MSINRRPSNRRGLTRTEVVVSSVLLLLAFMVGAPWLYQQRLQSRRTLCENRQWEIALAMQRRANTEGEFPGYRNLLAVDHEGTRRDTSWVLPILPHLLYDDETEKPGPYLGLATEHGPAGPEATRGRQPDEYLPELVCPDDSPNGEDRRAAWLSFVVNTGMPDAPASDAFPSDWLANGVFFDQFREVPPEQESQRHSTLDTVDQLTLLLSENVDSGYWTDTGEAQLGFVWRPQDVPAGVVAGPRPLRINRRRGEGDGSIVFARPSSRHVGGGVNVTLVSGATQFLSEKVNQLVLARRMAANGTELRWPGSDVSVDSPYRREVGKPE